MTAVLPLAHGGVRVDDQTSKTCGEDAMFVVDCEGHGHRVLLGYDHIEALVNRRNGIELRWRCDQGHRGTTLLRHPHRRGGPI